MSCPELIVQSLWEMPSPHSFFTNWAAVTNRVVITTSSSSQGFWTQRGVTNSSSSLFGLGNGNAIAADCSLYIACESCRAYKWVMSHVWMSHVPHKHAHVTHKGNAIAADCSFYIACELCRIWKWVMSHVWMNHVPHVNKPRHTHR